MSRHHHYIGNRCGRTEGSTDVTDKRFVQNFIEGHSVEARDGRRTDLIDPSTGEIFGWLEDYTRIKHVMHNIEA
jgi:hypothetical protein